MRDTGINDSRFTDAIDKGVNVEVFIRKFIANHRKNAKSIISKHLKETGINIILAELGEDTEEGEYFWKLNEVLLGFFVKKSLDGGHMPFDYVAVTKDSEVCIVEVKSTTIGNRDTNFSNREREAIKEAKNVGITVIVATVNFETSWNLTVKLK